MRVVMCSCPPDEADRLVSGVVEGRLASAITTVPGVQKTLMLGGGARESSETLLLIQTADGTLGPLLDLLAERHPAPLPDIVVLQVLSGHGPYLRMAEEGAPPAPIPVEDDLYIQDDGQPF